MKVLVSNYHHLQRVEDETIMRGAGRARVDLLHRWGINTLVRMEMRTEPSLQVHKIRSAKPLGTEDVHGDDALFASRVRESRRA